MHVGIVDSQDIVRILASTKPIKDLLVVSQLKQNSVLLKKREGSGKSRCFAELGQWIHHYVGGMKEAEIFKIKKAKKETSSSSGVRREINSIQEMKLMSLSPTTTLEYARILECYPKPADQFPQNGAPSGLVRPAWKRTSHEHTPGTASDTLQLSE